ncbi:FRE1F [Auxenochlorella protothecoides x Auxenochlorella symbiontica]
MIVTSVHGLLYYFYWGVTHQFWAMFSDWSTVHSMNALAGSISWFFGLALWLTSMDWCRRAFWEVYYRCHIVGFLGFMLFAYIHYSGSWVYFCPGPLLWCIDLALRSGALANTTTVAHSAVDASEDVITLQLQGSKRVRGCPIHDIALLVPSISRWQWHPFTISHQSADGMLTMRIKKQGAWSRELLARLKRRESLPVRASLPPYGAPHQWRQDEVVVVMAGGTASTAVLRVLSDLVARRAQGKATGPRRVHFVWVARHAIEFCGLDCAVADAAMNADGWLAASLYYTGREPLPASKEPRATGALEKPSSHDSDTRSEELPTIKGADSTIPASFPLASPFWWNRVRKLQPQATGPLHLAIVTALTFFGGFVGHFVTYSWTAEWETHYASLGEEPDMRPIEWRNAALASFGVIVGGLGLSFFLAIFIPGLVRYWRDTRTGSATDEQMGVDSSVHDPVVVGCSLVGDQLMIPGTDLGMPIASGRPDFAAVLQAAAKETGAKHVGVYVAGPEPLAQAAHLAICELNGSGKGCAHFDFHNMAGFL